MPIEVEMECEFPIAIRDKKRIILTMHQTERARGGCNKSKPAAILYPQEAQR
jgi:hypothetical protein